MLIENAFLKLPELMLSSHQHSGKVEANIVSLLVTGLQMELNSRSIPFAFNHIIIEKPYPQTKKKGIVYRADFFFDSKGCVPESSLLYQYGFKEFQWLEAKIFFGFKKSKPPKTKKIGDIIKDILRLCLFPIELQGKIRQNGRYLLLVFDSKPADYLAFSDRAWLKSMFEDKNPDLVIDLQDEPKTLLRSIVNNDSVKIRIKVKLANYIFEPIFENFPLPYRGYLFRIDRYDISINKKSISFKGSPGEYWGPEEIEQLKIMKEEFINFLKKDNSEETNS